MVTIKSYTDISQSKTLSKILPIESADMRYAPFGDTHPWVWDGNLLERGAIPCWSLAALLNILAKIASKIDDDGSANLSSFMEQWSVNMFDCPVEATDNYDNPIDACVAMIEKLHELNLLRL